MGSIPVTEYCSNSSRASRPPCLAGIVIKTQLVWTTLQKCENSWSEHLILHYARVVYGFTARFRKWLRCFSLPKSSLTFSFGISTSHS